MPTRSARPSRADHRAPCGISRHRLHADKSGSVVKDQIRCTIVTISLRAPSGLPRDRPLSHEIWADGNQFRAIGEPSSWLASRTPPDPFLNAAEDKDQQVVDRGSRFGHRFESTAGSAVGVVNGPGTAPADERRRA